MLKKILLATFFLVLITHFLYRVYSFRGKYTVPFNGGYWQYRYDHSQWITPSDCKNIDPHINPETCVWDDAWYAANKDKPFVYHKLESLGDDGLYTYAGWKLIQGDNPAFVNAEIPPLGKYLIGASAVYLGNQNIYSLIMAVGVLLTLYDYNFLLFKQKLPALIAVSLFSFEPLFYEQFSAPFLDLQLLFFLLLTLTFFLREKYLFSAISLGLFAATKSPFLGILIALSCLTFLALNKEITKLKKYTLSLILSPIVYILTYLMYFLNNYSVLEFLSLQKWIVSFYLKGARPSFIGMVLPMLFNGTWYTWWGKVLRVREWNILWTILMLLMLPVGWLLRKSERKPVFLTLIWVIIYFTFLLFTPVWPRYLLLLLPFLYNLAIWLILKKVHPKYLRGRF